MFRSSRLHVDHGLRFEGPHILDWRTLGILPSFGHGSNLAQGQTMVRRYATSGGLKTLVHGKDPRAKAKAKAKSRVHAKGGAKLVRRVR